MGRLAESTVVIVWWTSSTFHVSEQSSLKCGSVIYQWGVLILSSLWNSSECEVWKCYISVRCTDIVLSVELFWVWSVEVLHISEVYWYCPLCATLLSVKCGSVTYQWGVLILSSLWNSSECEVWKCYMSLRCTDIVLSVQLFCAAHVYYRL